ncbi:hypothetical protein [Aeromicrobium sp. IC_218]|uniref:hypothetical protein n=1 Tax=Aeromicrobium sp. IC_218 TaxID=2545468 RepID=UPI001A955FA6|nr:hypothetical protein [Aeromicrobium sp. IC_218]
MSDRVDEALKHRYIYLPRGTEKDTLGPGKQLGLDLARGHGARLTVLSAQKSGATDHAELAKQSIVTERSGYIEDGGVVLAWCPRHKTMEKLHHLEKSVVVLVEWIPGEMEAWAKLNRAYNIVTGEVIDAALSDQAAEILERIVQEGYKGWTDSISERMVSGWLNDLAARNEYDHDLVLAYVRQTKHESSIERLQKIIGKFEASSGHTHASSRRGSCDHASSRSQRLLARR